MGAVVITGGATGIGLAIAERFLENNWQAMIASRNMKRLVEMKDALVGKYGTDPIDCCATDVADEESVKSLQKATHERFGTVDTFINNAGIVIKAFAHEMEAREGAIVNITSVSGMFGDYGMTAYNASKAAVINMTRAMALDYGKYGIRVNNVAPGPTDTSMFPQEMKSAFSKNSPLGRIVEPDEVAKVVFFMSTDDSSAITGETILVTAGFEISTDALLGA